MTAVASPLPPSGGVWQNWSGNARCVPDRAVMPANEDDLRLTVRDAASLRVVGAGHSFTPLVPTQGTLVSLDHLQGLIDHDPDHHRARIWTGTRLFQIGPLLEKLGQALPNMGDIDRQSIAGVLSTATHGTGEKLPCIAAGLRSLRFVGADGQILECSPEQDRTLFRAAAVSLGTLGVITQAELQNVPSYRLKERVWAMPLNQVLSDLNNLKNGQEHFEFWAFPAGGQAIVKTLNSTTQDSDSKTEGSDSQDFLLKLCSELTRLCPPLAGPLQKLVGSVIQLSERVGLWYQVYPSARNVRFNEMEYHVPAEVGPECMEELCRTLRRDARAVFFPVEYRYVAGDDFMLSPFGDGPRASIAVHQYHKQDHRPLFELAEPILRRYGGRPHWGKLHSLDSAALHQLYPELGDFLKLRQQLDPDGKFLNDHLRTVFGLA